MIEIVPATMAHAARLYLREGDRREIEALGLHKMQAIKMSLDRSITAETYIADGEIAAIAGCQMTCMTGGQGVPWLLTGEPVNRHKKEFLRHTRARVEEMRRRHGSLVNMVHAEYAEAVRWLKWLGFEIGAPVPLGPYGAKFVRVVLQ